MRTSPKLLLVGITLCWGSVALAWEPVNLAEQVRAAQALRDEGEYEKACDVARRALAGALVRDEASAIAISQLHQVLARDAVRLKAFSEADQEFRKACQASADPRALLAGMTKEASDRYVQQCRAVWSPIADLKTLPSYRFVEIPARYFDMGCLDTDTRCTDAERPRHPVQFTRSWLLGETEVTRELYQAVMGGQALPPGTDPNLPMDRVSWLDAVRFCNRLSELEGRKPAYTIDGAAVRWDRAADGYRLPTEAEWEYVARAGGDHDFGEGSAEADLARLGWFNGNSGGRAHPVGEKGPNPMGVRGLYGNVWEWVWDWYAADTYRMADLQDPSGPDAGTVRVNRGGSAWDPARWNRATARHFLPPDQASGDLGFRIARTVGP